MVVKVFISSNQKEFSTERKFLFDELKKTLISVAILNCLYLKRILPDHFLLMKYF